MNWSCQLYSASLCHVPSYHPSSKLCFAPLKYFPTRSGGTSQNWNIETHDLDNASQQLYHLRRKLSKPSLQTQQDFEGVWAREDFWLVTRIHSSSQGTDPFIQQQKYIQDSKESLSHHGWKTSARSSLVLDQTPPHQLIHSIKCHLKSFLEHFQGCWATHADIAPSTHSSQTMQTISAWFQKCRKQGVTKFIRDTKTYIKSKVNYAAPASEAQRVTCRSCQKPEGRVETQNQCISPDSHLEFSITVRSG